MPAPHALLVAVRHAQIDQVVVERVLEISVDEHRRKGVSSGLLNSKYSLFVY